MSWTTAPVAFYDDMDRSRWADQVSHEIADNVLITLVSRRIGFSWAKTVRSYQYMAEIANEAENHTVAAVRAQVVTRASEHPRLDQAAT